MDLSTTRSGNGQARLSDRPENGAMLSLANALKTY